LVQNLSLISLENFYMKLIEIRVLRGPNFWSIKKHKLIQATIDLEALEHQPTNEIPGFYDRLNALIPSLYQHECSRSKEGGFFERVKEGTWMGHVIEHIAIEIQNLAGIPVGFGRVRGTGKEGIYHMVFEYDEEKEGMYTLHAAVRIAEALISGDNYDLEKDIEEIKNLWMDQKFGPSTNSLIEEAKRRNIPYIKLDDDALVQLGYGSKQNRIEATITSNTSNIAVDIAGDKDRTKKLLTSVNIPAPHGLIIHEVENLKETIEEVGFPLVVKPLDGNHGNGASINITTYEEAVKAFHMAKEFSDSVIIEKYISGCDFRVLVINNKFVAAALRTPASVVGDGTHTISQLVDIANSDPKRGNGHDNVLTKIELNDICDNLLSRNGLTMESVPQKGKRVYLKPTANLSTGGTATDVTDEVHPSNILLFERAARLIGLDICGIDVMAPDLKTPIKQNGGAIIELNAAPGFRMHLQPSYGTPRNVAEPVVDMLFPNNDQGRIPIVAITGTNGKTTTTRLMAHIAQTAGFNTGYTTTDGIYINQVLVETGDCSGPWSAKFVLKDPSVDFAVLETARGGMLRNGMAFDKCNAAIVTNVAEDHLGMDGIDTVEKLAKVKSIVPETVMENGYAILNADDDLVYAMKDRVKCNIALFSLYNDNIRVERHCAGGGLAAIYEGGYLLLRKGNQIIPIEEVTNIPITFGGKADFNIANALAATLAAYTNGIGLEVIQTALKSFVPSVETIPGRLNIFEFTNFKLLLDYAHNPHGVRALGKFVQSFEDARKVGVITGVGDRRDEDIIALGEEAGKIFDEIVIRHDDDLRGRAAKEIDLLLTKGIHNINPAIPVVYHSNECRAVEFAIQRARPGDLVVVLIDNVSEAAQCIQEQLKKDKMRSIRMKAAV
jgi:cyanophycin synthetase